MIKMMMMMMMMMTMMMMMIMNINNEYDGAAYVNDMIDDDE